MVRCIAFALGALAAWAAPAFAQGRVEATTTQLIVKFRAGGAHAPLTSRARVEALAQESGVLFSHQRDMAVGAQVVRLFRPMPVAEARALAQRLAARAEVEYAQPDYARRRLLIPNDPAVTQGPAAQQQQNYLDASPAAINAFGAWDITTGSPSTVIAVVDNGILAHPELAGRILPGYDFISNPTIANDGDGRDPDPTDPGDWMTAADVANTAVFDSSYGCKVEDSSWHGTAVAGVIAANSNNGTGVAGLDWSAKILPVRTIGKCVGLDSDILDGVSWAGGLSVPGVPNNSNPAQIINLSVGGSPACDLATQDVLNQVLAHGTTRAIVAAAGNESADVSTSSPAGCSGVIAVAATTRAGSLATYSNFGRGITVAAPGGDVTGFPSNPTDVIVSLWNSGTTTAKSDIYGLFAGTSFATPIVAGVVSLMLSVAPNLTAAQVRQVLTSTAKPFPAGSTCDTTRCGAGIVDAHAAVLAAQALTGAPPVNVQGLWWATGGTESGWGINFAHQGAQVFATWYTYDANGNAWWLSMLATRTTGNTYTGTIYTTQGHSFNSVPFLPVTTPALPVGNGTLSFTDANNGSFAYAITVGTSVSQAKSLARYDLGTGAQPTCTYSASTPNFAAATNYQDLWWVANGAESGWGINFAHQGNSIFATWYTYDVNGAPLWLSVLATFNGAVYQGTLYRTAGPRFDDYLNTANKLTTTPVGTATLAFTDGNHATFSYATTGAGNLPAANQTKQVTRIPFAASGGTLCQ